MTSKPTPGPWEIDDSRGKGGPEDRLCIQAGDNIPVNGVVPCVLNRHLPNALANAALIADAGTVYHETGYSPRDLHERLLGARLARDDYKAQRDELLAALEFYANAEAWKDVDTGIGTFPGDAIDYGATARDAIARAGQK